MARNPIPKGTKRWSTLAKETDAEVFAYFKGAPLNQTNEHALASLRLLRSKFHESGTRRATPTPKNNVVLDARVVAQAQGLAIAPPKNPPVFQAEEVKMAKGAIINNVRAVAERMRADMVIFDEFPGDKGVRGVWEGQYQISPVETRKPAPAPVPEPAQRPAKDGSLAGLAAMLSPHFADEFEPMIRAAVERMHADLAANQAQRLVVVREQEKRALAGIHHNAAPKLIQLAAQGLNVMMVGPAGCGKTVLAKSVADAVDAKLTVVSCRAGMSEAQLLGRLLPLGAGGAFRYVESPFMRAYREGGVILLDEIDAADANLLLVINAALANGGIDVEARAANEVETHVTRHPKTIILAAANTWGSGADTQYIGRGALDVSTLDRFYRLAIDYDAALESTLGTAQIVAYVQVLRDKARGAKLRRVVSTRMIQRLSAAVAAGISLEEAKRDELASWTADERAKVGAS